MIDKYTKELERALNPMKWDKELNDTWHKNIPDLQKAFDAIKDIVIKRAEVKMKYEIEIEGLPEGWEPVAFRKPLIGEKMFQYGKIHRCNCEAEISSLIVKKKQPRRIVLEDTGRNSSSIKVGEFGLSKDGSFYRCEEPTKWGSEYPVWRIVEDSGEKND